MAVYGIIMKISSPFIVCLFVVQGDEQGEDAGARKGFQVTAVVSALAGIHCPCCILKLSQYLM